MHVTGSQVKFHYLHKKYFDMDKNAASLIVKYLFHNCITLNTERLFISSHNFIFWWGGVGNEPVAPFYN